MEPGVIPGWLLDSGLSPGPLVVYAHLSRAANIARVVRADVPTIAAHMRCTPTSVYRYLQDLRRVGAIGRIPGRGVYVLTWDRPESVA